MGWGGDQGENGRHKPKRIRKKKTNQIFSHLFLGKYAVKLYV